MYKRFLIILLGVSLILQVQGQIKTSGLPYIRNYTKSEYSAGTQQWDILQDSRGIMYFANNDGILEFDGENWRLYPVSNNSIVRSLAISESGRIFAGAFNEFGYLRPVAGGDIQYVSLIDKVPENEQDFGEIWQIHVTSQGIFFQSFSHIFLFSGGKIKTLASHRDFLHSYVIDDRFFILDRQKGLMELRGSKLYKVDDGERFNDEREIWCMLPFVDDQILIGTQQDGLFIYDGYSIKPFNAPINNALSNKQIFSATRISDEFYAFGTIQDGLYIMNREGKMVQHINKDKGLQNNTILSIYKDRRGQLWLGLDNGIDYVRINSPFSYLNEGFGIEGTGYASALFNDKLYLGTNQGVFYKKWHPEGHTRGKPFQLLQESKGQVWKLKVFDDQLILGHNKGTFLVEKNNNTRLIDDRLGGWEYVQLKDHPDKLLSGNYTGLSIFNKNRYGKWTFANRIKGLEESCRIIEQDSIGNIWISHGYKGIYRLRLNNALDSITELEFFNADDHLPSNIDNYVYKLNDEVLFGTSEGIYQYSNETFKPHATWNAIFGEGKNVRFPVVDAQGNIWYSVNEKPLLLKKKGTGYKLCDSIFNRIGDALVGGFEHIRPIDPKNVILGTEDGFIHYDPTYEDTRTHKFHTLIRQVVSTMKKDSVVFRGTYMDEMGYKTLKSKKETDATLKFKRNDLLFNFSAVYFENKQGISYRIKLDGYDENWSEWHSKNFKEYTNLPHGEYSFKVKAKTETGYISDIAAYRFKILPPIYLTKWAYAVYVLLFIGLVLLIIRHVRRRINREKRKMAEQQKKELDAKEEEYQRERLMREQKIIRLRNEKLQAEVEKKRTDMELKNKELASVAMQITHKNEVLDQVKRKLRQVSENINDEARGEVGKLISTIESDVRMDKDWSRFQKHFEEVHSDFFDRLRSKYPELTPKDVRLCAYLRMNMSTKEIALISNISTRGVEISRYRLRKKFNLDKEENLTDFIMDI
ncbi:MAG: hypothetical protein K9I94_09040 [Bacteroidales bacterium]|nr:hypothetical protein [Bacteroidales bacterium]